MPDENELTLEQVKMQLDGLAQKIGHIDADVAAALLKNGETLTAIQSKQEAEFAAMSGKISDLATRVDAVASAKPGVQGEAMAGGGDPANVPAGTPMNWGGQ
jgi:hypothetical protein